MSAAWRKWHFDACLVDGHMDTFYKELEEGRSWFRPQPKWHIDYARLRKSGTDLQVCAIYTPPQYEGGEATLFASRMIGRALAAERDGRGRVRVVRSRADLTGLGRGATGLLVSIEGGLPLAGKLDMLDVFFAMGVRAMGLTHNPRNLLADGASVKRARGLTAFGKDVVRRLDALGMMIDVAHLHLVGFRDLIRIARGPIVSSHTGLCRFLDRPRNLTDWQVKKIAETGGVIAIDYLTEHLTGGPAPAGVKDVVDQMEAVADMVGVDHVALGSDFDGYSSVTTGLEDVTGVPNITRELARRGWGERDVKKILGGNFLRVLRKVLR
jgi:membrane dipeptidase